MDGRALAAAARTGNPGIAVLFITGNEDQAAVLAADETVLIKPFTMPQLTAAVTALLERTR
jgi:DNA-binding response OmpR family regulator